MIRIASTNLGALPLLLALLLAACSPYSSGDYENAVYDTAHFRLYFKERDFTLSEVKAIGERKERLLTAINRALDVQFDGIIPTYLYRGYYSGFASYDGTSRESRDYVLVDDGHEIVHQVCFSELGTTENLFMAEGMAEMLCIHLQGYNAIDAFVHWRDDWDAVYGCDSSWRANEGDAENQLAFDGFHSTSYDYQQAGAFLEWLQMNNGIEKAKLLYRASQAKNGAELAAAFQQVFGVTLTDAVQGFTDKYLRIIPCADPVSSSAVQ
jgi:hypothetical protein